GSRSRHAPPKARSSRMGARFARRRYGVMPDPGAAIAHNTKVGRSYALFELGVERWRAMDRGLKDLAVMAAAAKIGCAWCMDFGYWESTMRHKVPAEKIRAVPHWRDSDVFTEPERLVLEYAEAMTDTPPSVTDEMVGRRRTHLSGAGRGGIPANVAGEDLGVRGKHATGGARQGVQGR